MPNIITHSIFCEEVMNTIKNEKYKAIINNHKKDYHIGTNGPDFLFFHDFYPFWKPQNKRVANIATKFHNAHINSFYDIALTQYAKQPAGEPKDAMAAYICGHYLHWQLDSIMHPYVVYKTGFKTKMSKYYHHRFESMMDTIMLDRFRNQSIKTYVTYRNCWQSQHSAEVISQIYCECSKQLLKEEIDYETITKALQDWELAQRYLYDPKGIKYQLIKSYEWLIRKPWLFSGNIVRAKIDETHDIMNDQHQLWLHPCTGTQSKESVNDLFIKALHESEIGLPLLFDALQENQKKDAFLAFLDDKTYANGINQPLPRIHKELIYSK